jgi:hypothetical protein
MKELTAEFVEWKLEISQLFVSDSFERELWISFARNRVSRRILGNH